MATIGDERLSLACHSSHKSHTQTLQPPRGRVPRERHDFYGDVTMDTKTVDELGLVDDDNQLLTDAAR